MNLKFFCVSELDNEYKIDRSKCFAISNVLAMICCGPLSFWFEGGVIKTYGEVTVADPRTLN